MEIINISGYSLINLNNVNIVLGKNGCGKSRLIRTVEQNLLSNNPAFGKAKYITPERGGSLIYEAGIEQNLTDSPSWLPDTRRNNQYNQFRQQSVVQYRKLETLILREIERGKRSDHAYTFDLYVDKINDLLDNIRIARDDTTFKIYQKGDDTELNAGMISSGESELISLGIECLVFSKECVPNKDNMLFLDEPDVHLHPDLQVRLMHFLINLVEENAFKIVLSTHSTAILGALESQHNAHIAFMKSGQTCLEFKPITPVYRSILPVFGAHPLSNIFNEAPLLLVEGEDDERIWQQAVRSSNGRVKVYPCPTGGISELNDYEQEAKNIIQAVYDNATAYSLRDRDDSDGTIDDILPVVRLKLSCRNAENLLLTDEVLSKLGMDWAALQAGIEHWLDVNTAHPNFLVMSGFKESDFDRMNYDIKSIRNDLVGITGSSKPWEVAVGQTLAELVADNSIDFNKEGSIYSFLGEKIINNLIP
ncbi:MAG: hypothetical protein UU65_C0002G0225 [candidate division CPR2 bacterium GW2011_GWC1_41_48]|uniref:ATPase AAA-type core domain-containing protein n=1 Tax=candidate division CPR2 bacterium GW2011_GWC1_41_48 TaxID=1618344 RepID=A0A0G0WBK1_UNCC2|nr:MAG: hypothetical protein UT47_C0002G0079 [candidate division CPR2 bacterium GW2011_GWC2_39_35]KKR27567.1 MAG: hypothetical protein UT60_C0045G0003 [candidate division CPR2 bacterium GW2011_GWD2_39_7]KKR29590.1 MAG: hypothetical protein UT59_C0004G0016 [candidate division CPR2 bacterium GW2011_GWD1_39_7]KKS09447.1 MAG: hypothetical protein UU65_C0002G0225 [candidate division CPR2 bacterium GW2011_GWC1_41_48]OGB55912.1 MAG: hypothetical protein A2Y27_00715 [candidate division CPR2 bacterium G